MSYNDAHNRLRHAVAFLYREQHRIDRQSVLREAWKPLSSLRDEDFPSEFRSLFAYLQHEMAYSEREELSPREINLLIRKIHELELKWIEPPSEQPCEEV